MGVSKSTIINSLESLAKQANKHPIGSPQRKQLDKRIDSLLIRLDEAKKTTKTKKTKPV